MAASLANLTKELIQGSNFSPCPANVFQCALVHIRDISIGCETEKMGVVQVTALAFGLILGMSPHTFFNDGDRQTIRRRNSLECLPG